jgi:hypothetical protein
VFGFFKLPILFLIERNEKIRVIFLELRGGIVRLRASSRVLRIRIQMPVESCMNELIS